MKANVVATAALLGVASAHQHHAHQAFHKRQTEPDVVCSVVYETVTGSDFIWHPTPDAPPANPDSTTTSTSTTTRKTTISQTVTSVAVVPTPVVQTLPTPGTYTFPESTMTVTNTTSALVPSTTSVSPGTHTLGGVTTIVETATTVVCPYATTSTDSAGVVTSVIQSTTYVCPSAGTYTIAPITTTVTDTETVTVPVISTYPPGTYTAPAITTVVETATVIYCPFESSTAAPTTSSTSVAAPAPEPTTSTAVPVVASSSAAPSVVQASSAPPSVVASASSIVASSSTVVASSSTVVASSSSAVPTETSTSSTGAIGQWALTYTPYNPATGNCQTADQVSADLLAISLAGFSTIRIYSTDCDTLPNVGSAAAAQGLRIIPGVYVSATGCTIDSADIAEQVSAFQAWEHWDLVEFMAVGNEALNNGYCSGQQLADLIVGVKSALGSVYSGTYTTTDVVSAWEVEGNAAAVCAVVDFPSANVHSYFTESVAPEDAGDFVTSQLAIVEKMCGNKASGYILESGYPTAGTAIGLNIPSVANQAIAIASILDAAGSKTVLFSMFDDQWKSPGAYDCEQHWGIAPDLFGVVADAWEALVTAL